MTADRERPPIEPLSDAAWTRIERAVWSELDADAAPAPLPVRRSWRAAWIGGAALAAAAVIAVFALRDAGGSGGGYGSADGPSRIATADGASDVTFGDAQVKVAPHSAVVLTGTAEAGATIVIERGAASFAVAPRGDRPPFVVHAGEVTVRVVGTRFGVERVGERARVTVQEGAVLVVAPGEHVMVRAGEQWPVMTTLIDNTATGSAAPGADTPGPSTAPVPTPAVPAPGTVPTPTGDTGAPTDRATEPRTRPTLDPARAFAAAAALEATDPTAALAGYHALARGSGAWAANALYAAGRLASERGDTARARTDLTAYLRRFPRGANARDAQQLLAHLP